jgi:hypothetical protein
LTLSEQLSEYSLSIVAWMDAARKQTAAVHRLQRAVADGNVRDMEKLRQAAVAAAEQVSAAAAACAPFEFDARAYLDPGGDFVRELSEAAERAGVRMYVREGIIYCYPVLIQPQPDLSAVRIDRRLDPAIRPETLAANLKKLQSKEPKSRPDQFIESLFRAYNFVRASRGHEDYAAERLADIYSVLTILPGARGDYSELEFTRDIYALDVSTLDKTRTGSVMSFASSTGSKERGAKVYRFVARDGTQKDYAAVRFVPPKSRE